MKKKLIVAMITVAVMAASVACANTKTEPKDNSVEENNSVETASSEVSMEEATEPGNEDSSVEASTEERKTLTDEDRKKMHAMSDVTGEVDGNSYENAFFNIKFDLDDSYTFSTADELKEINGIDIDFNNDIEVRQAIDKGDMVVVAHASDKTDAAPANNIFDVMVQAVELEVGLFANEEAFLEECKSSVLPSLPNATAEIDTITFLGEEHPSLYIKANVDGEDIYKRYVCRFKPQFVSLYSVMGRDADTFDEVIRNAETVNE